ncbi:MAG: GreA/GreB family elongation factor [Gammaproteobacteria bacterium]
MSRAFIKEPDGDQEEAPLLERPISPHPNYVTPRGLSLLKAKVEQLQAERDAIKTAPDLAARSRLPQVERDLRYFQRRLWDAIEVHPPMSSETPEVRFGSSVEMVDAQGRRYRYRLVGEDEADAGQGLISWISPLAKALMGNGVGAEVYWRKPSGELAVTIVKID